MIADIASAALADPVRWYAERLERELVGGEPELGLLPLLIPAGATVLDVGANLGVFAFAMSFWAARVEAFEPHPELVAFARRMLADRATVHATAVSDHMGSGRLRVPVSAGGEPMHLAGNLASSHSEYEHNLEYDVEVVTLDAIRLSKVGFIKIDVEGAELQVLDGARALLARDRPVLLVELLAGTYLDPRSAAEKISSEYGYDPFVLHAGRLEPADAVIRGLGSNSTWGTAYKTRNVIFRPRE